MKIAGKSTLDAPRDQVWEALNTMDVLARIVPGCERLEQVGENEFEGTVKIGIQSIKGVYSGKIRLEDIDPPRHYKLVAAGRSANGVVDGAGTVDLEEQDGKTILTYSGDAQIGGTLASVGQRLIEGASKQMINQSLKALAEQIRLRNSPAEAEPPAPEPAQTSGGPATLAGEAEQAKPAQTSGGPATLAGEAEQAEPAQTSGGPATLAGEAEQAEPPAPPAAEPTVPVTTETPAASQASFERRAVVVPADEQLKPETVMRGVVEDMVKERPWLPWVLVAFLLGVLFGRAGRG